MARTWTRDQEDAIRARRGTLLVSAAAGSGKTSVLVERFLERITDEENPSDADRLLVVTYTRAAAEEMRGRISRRIDSLLESDPGNLHLRRQQILLSHAHISTIHSFCADLVRENFFRLGIAPDFRILEDSELKVLREDALERVLNRYYEQDDPDFFRLADAFSTGRDDWKMASAVETVYDFVRSHPFEERWMREKAALYRTEEPFSQTMWGRALFFYGEQAAAYSVELLRSCLSSMEGEEDMEKAYGEAYRSDLQEAEAVLCSIRAGQWDETVKRLSSLQWMRAKPLRGRGDDPLKEKLVSGRKQAQKELEGLRKLFSANEAECALDLENLAPLAEKLFEVTRAFSQELDEEKARRRAADFGDLEHWALRLLVQDTEEGPVFTQEARETAARFDEIMVDEYQDTNEAQDMIFRAVSRKEENLFMVGDVKQSIYRFRQAMPEIFLRRKAEYSLYSREKDTYPACVVLDQNFRSVSGVTDAVNFVFRELMSREAGELEYTESEELKPGAVYPPAEEPAMRLDVIDLSAGEEKDIVRAESRHIAELIYRMTAEETVTEGGVQRPVRFSDIAILLRSHTKYGPLYARELSSLGIPAASERSGGFFAASEVQVMLALLKVIDNPMQDIPLLAVLMSPIYGFTPDKMAEIRLKYRQGSFYSAILAAESEGEEALRRFKEDLSRFRTLAATLSADRLVAAVCRETGYADMAQAMPGGAARLQNLHYLQNYAAAYEAGGYTGLSGFLRFIGRLEKQKADLPGAAEGETPEAVRIMSIHKSKGLEFPVCILAGCDRSFNKDRADLLLHPVLGMGAKLLDPVLSIRRTTLPREAVALELERGEMSEELRVLYVAMTRAKEKLIAVAAVKNADKLLGSLSSQIQPGKKIAPYVVRSCRSISEWLLLCALRHPDGTLLRERAGASSSITEPAKEHWAIRLLRVQAGEEEIREMAEAPEDAKPDEGLLQQLREKLDFQYPGHALSGIPAKVTASDLASRQEEREYAATARPAFLSKKGMTPAERGTALHTFLQFASWEKAAQDPEKELSRLVKEQYITEEQKNAVELDKAARFFASPVAKRILQAEKLYREYRFTVEIPAERASPGKEGLSGEKVILQGAVDCAFEEEGALVIVDFKTDRVASGEELLSRYALQLALYKEALEQCLDLPVKECMLYSFHLGKELPLSL